MQAALLCALIHLLLIPNCPFTHQVLKLVGQAAPEEFMGR